MSCECTATLPETRRIAYPASLSACCRAETAFPLTTTMLASYPAQWAPSPLDDESVSPYQYQQYQFQFHVDVHQQKQQQQAPHAHPVPAPAQPLIPDDDGDGFAFSHYIAHEDKTKVTQSPLQLSPSTPSLSAYSGSSGPFSAITPPSAINFTSSSYSELQGFNTYYPSPVSPPAPASASAPRAIAPAPAPAPAPKKRPSAELQEDKAEPKAEAKRPSGACTRCKKMKVGGCETAKSPG
jgi:hypothetical protein